MRKQKNLQTWVDVSDFFGISRHVKDFDGSGAEIAIVNFFRDMLKFRRKLAVHLLKKGPRA